MDSHSNKLEALEIFNMNEKNVIAWFLFLNLLPICQLFKNFRACLHGVGDPGLVGWVSFFSRSGGNKTKETYPTRPGSPTPCKQGLRPFNKMFIL